MTELSIISKQVTEALKALLDENRPHFNPVRLLVIGCSSSEITGGAIGRASSPDAGAAVARAALETCGARGVDVAFQCCEHLNRALVVPRAAAELMGLEPVWVVPRASAGGACAAAAYRAMNDPVVVESVRADAGIDIGGTLIGMHLRAVAVPVRLPVHRIGEAELLAARTRPRLIGGKRAQYDAE